MGAQPPNTRVVVLNASHWEFAGLCDFLKLPRRFRRLEASGIRPAGAGTGRVLVGVAVIELARDLEFGSPPVAQGQTLMAQDKPGTLRRGRNLPALIRTFCPSRTNLMAALLNLSPTRRPGTIRELKVLPSPSLRLRTSAAESPPNTNTADPHCRRALFY
jgi:hypothetical protein